MLIHRRLDNRLLRMEAERKTEKQLEKKFFRGFEITASFAYRHREINRRSLRKEAVIMAGSTKQKACPVWHAHESEVNQ